MVAPRQPSAKSKRILVLAAHPDDECLGCGGTIARLAAEGHEVSIGILATGLTSRGTTTTAELETLMSQADNASKFLGASIVSFGNLPDQRLDTIGGLDISEVIKHLLDLYQPEVVYTHHIGDLNQDHRAMAHATLIATRPVPGCSVKSVYAYEVASSTEWAFSTEPAFRPTTFVDISGDYLEKKIQAMEMYETERRPFPHPRSPEALRAQAMLRGAQSGLMAAEAFQLVREIR